MVDCGPGCEETLRDIEAFLDGEVEAMVRLRIEQHLTGCHGCTERTEFRRHLKIVISSKCAEGSVPEVFADRIRAMIHELDPLHE